MAMKSPVQKKNIRIRNALDTYRVFAYELAEAMGISSSTLQIKMRKELPKADQDKAVELIKKIAASREN